MSNVCQCNYATFLCTKRTNQDDTLAAKHPVISKQANTARNRSKRANTARNRSKRANIARNRICYYTLHRVHVSTSA